MASIPSTPLADSSLAELLAQSLPEHVQLHSYHISTPPSRCTPLFAPPPFPPNTKPQSTYCESHSLLVTLADPADHQSHTSGSPASQIALFAIEVQIFTTATLTTVFVSKADSTGYLSLLPNNSSRSSPSILRSIASTFVSWIIRHRHRPDRPLVLSLFARAQNQYLFPGSSNNGKKHVLDDRALVKWWCKTLDPVLREYDPPPPSFNLTDEPDKPRPKPASTHSEAHLIVPGHDPYETAAFFPPSARLDPAIAKRWVNTYPLRQIAPYPNAPPRCLVPHFPDDPKARFLLELDDELSTAPVPANLSLSTLKHQSPKKRGVGQWRSIKTLDQFWEMMAFRQECSSGRLVGFVWVLFTPSASPPSLPALTNITEQTPPLSSKSSSPSPSPVASPSDEKLKSTPKPKTVKPPSTTTPAKRSKRATFLSKKRTHQKNRFGNRRKTRTGPIIPCTPRIKSEKNEPRLLNSPSATTTKYYHSPPYARGTLILSQKAYDRMHELFLRLDFSNIEAARSSTRRWLLETSVVGYANEAAGHESKPRGSTEWGTKIAGKRRLDTTSEAGTHAPVQADGVPVLTVKRKRKQPDTEDAVADADRSKNSEVTSAAHVATPGSIDIAESAQASEPNVLHAGLVRKKPKLEPSEPGPASTPAENPAVNVLSAGLIRKKPKS